MRIYNIIKSNVHRATLITLMGVSVACNVEDINKLLQTTTLSGSVGDGPITQAQVSAKDSTGTIVGLGVSDTAANYSIQVTGTSTYPVVLTVSGGTDIVTGGEPDFNLVSAATSSAVDTVNINPFTTLIVKTAQAMPGGLTSANLSSATRSILEKLNFGLDPALVPDPITTPIDETNVAEIVKASEALGETIRRTYSALLAAGVDMDENAIIETMAADLTDGVLDGLGNTYNGNPSPLVAATVNVVSAQVLMEALVNKLNVGNADATVLMDTAIQTTMPTANTTTSDVVITNEMLSQARTAVAAAQAFSSDSKLAALAVILASLSGNSLAADIEAVMPADASSTFSDVITQLPLSGNSQFDAINSVVRNSGTSGGSTDTGNTNPSDGSNTGGGSSGGSPGTFEFSAPTYTVDEGAGVVNITINRVGGSDGVATLEWRTQTFNGYGTADWANDYGTFLWNERVLTFASGETSKTEQIAINQDSLVEGNETFTVLMQIPTGGIGSVGSVSSSVVTIVDDDVAPADGVAPVITLQGNNPLTLTLGNPYVESGAKATDNVDGDISSSIKVNSSSVNTNVAGTYSVTYNVSDSAGNAAIPVVRSVNVVNSSSASPWEDLVNQVIGFGRTTTGGKGGTVCWVSNLNDSGAGSLRQCAEDGTTSKWIRFKVSGVITLKSLIFMGSNKTIDGRGADITISQYGFRIENDENIIIENLKFTNQIVTKPNDLPYIDINRLARRVWVDHVTFSNSSNDAIGVGNYSTVAGTSPHDVTISWCRWEKVGKAILIGYDQKFTNDVDITVTLHHNYYNSDTERHPYARYGKVHTYNNYLYNWTYAAEASIQLAQLASENNIIEAGSKTIQMRGVATGSNVYNPEPGFARSQGDLFLGGAYADVNGADKVFNPHDFYNYTAEVADLNLEKRVVSGAGWQNVPAP